MRRLLAVLAAGGTVLLSSCGGGGGGSDSSPSPPALPLSVSVTVSSGADVSQAVSFSSSATTGSGLSFNWDFGDGTASTETSPQHTYAKPGDYTVRLTLGNSVSQISGTTTVQVNDSARLREFICTGTNGLGWCPLRYPQSSTSLADVFWSSTTQGLAVTAEGDIVATLNGGQTWTPHSLGIWLGSEQPQRLTLTDANTAWSFTDRHLWQSVDAGKHWTRLTAALAGGDGATGLFAQRGGRIWAPALNLYSGDAGKTWTTRTLPAEARGIFTHSGHFVDSYYTASGEPAGPMLPDGPLWWWDGQQARQSTDGGANWADVSAPSACEATFANALPPLQVRGNAFVAQLGARHASDGDRWAFCVSQDGGASWRPQTSEGLPTFLNYTGPKPSLYTPLSSADVRLLPSGGGWAWSGGLYRSTGLDQAWRVVALPAGFSSADILAAPDLNTVVISAKGPGTDPTGPQQDYVLGTSDGGVSWRSQRFGASRVQMLGTEGFAARGSSDFLSPAGQTLASVSQLTWHEPHLFDKTLGGGLLVSGNVGLLQATGRNSIWQTAWRDACDFTRGIAYGSVSRAWAVGGGGASDRVCMTRDGGASVQVLTAMTLNNASAADVRYYTDVAALDENKVWVARFDVGTSATTVLASTDAGSNWSAVTAVASLQSERLRVFDAQRLVVLGSAPGTFISGNCVATTTDAGQTWARTCFDASFRNIAWSDAQTLWLVGKTVMRSTDAGRTWSQVDITLPERAVLTALQFPTPNFGVMVGYSGLIMVTRDGGKTWQRQVQATGQELTGVSFIDTKNGWITGLGVSLSTGSGGD